MRVQDRKPRSPLARILGAMLMLSCAAGIAASDPAPNGIAGLPAAGTPPHWVQLVATDPATEEGKISRSSDTNQSPDPATPASAITGDTKETGNGETALLLDWHSDANNIYGANHPGEPPHPQQ